jgi:hypothetical protein
MKSIASSRPLAVLALCAAPLLFSACSKKEEPPPPPPPTAVPQPTATPVPAGVKVVSVDLGSAVGDDKKVKEAKATFEPKDTIYASVATEGSAEKAELTAKWTYGEKNQAVTEGMDTIKPSGPAVTELHIANPKGWPIGKYKVEILLDGKPAMTKEFEVKAAAKK